MYMKKIFFPALAMLALSACCEKPLPELKVDVWQSEGGTVTLDFLDGQEAACDSIHVWLDSIRSAYAEDEDPQITCRAQLIYQSPRYFTYLHEVRTQQSDYYEGDNSTHCLSFDRQTGRVITIDNLFQNTDSLAQQVLNYTRSENEWVIDAIGGDSTLLSLADEFSVGVTARGYMFSYPLMEGLWQILCTVPSGEIVK